MPIPLESVFPEPRLLIFADPKKPSLNDQAVIMAENQISKIDQFNITDGLALLIGCYYVFFVNYPTPSAAASGFLLFVQEMLLEIQD